MKEFKQKLSKALLVMSMAAELTPTTVDDDLVNVFQELVDETEILEKAYLIWCKLKGVDPCAHRSC